MGEAPVRPGAGATGGPPKPPALGGLDGQGEEGPPLAGGSFGHGRVCAAHGPATAVTAQNANAASDLDAFFRMARFLWVPVIMRDREFGDKGANLDASARLVMLCRRPRDIRGMPNRGETITMARYDFRTPRLYVEDRLATGARLMLPAPQWHYLKDVLRLKPGDGVLAFNGSDGEWRGTLVDGPKRSATLLIAEQTRPQTAPGDLHYLFAPLKRSRLDYMVQKAVEMGVSRLQPVLTRHTQAERVNGARMRANAIEAAEQCGVLNLPEVAAPATLPQALAALAPSRLLVFCDEDAPLANPLEALAAARPRTGRVLPLALLVGPEGGFHPEERALLAECEGVVRLALGPRILRADTAAVAALALVQAVLGDWGPRGVAAARGGDADHRLGEGLC